MEKKVDYTEQDAVMELSEAFRRMGIALGRRRTGDYLILWGFVLFAGGMLVGITKYGFLWNVAVLAGSVGTILITINRVRQMMRAGMNFPEGPYIGSMWLSLLLYAIIIFGIVKMTGKVSLTGIQVSLFFLNFAMLGYVLMGILIGKELAIIGILTSAASILSGLFLKKIFSFVMALICLVAFVGGGIYINKKWDIQK
ncbi:hypothetical protein JGI7_01085 [Candidatus Kryptonium thompsonii]|uniref:Uncharacterized protein n=2 Tax=Candidatus Kryptonium thompsonii TaxID=1633631 RepID=A0A0P1LAV0_9BACT|nr:hypothetical protein [Candidatus Kryptonium thompsoni]CUS77855.1 hypothetical protein JGI14_10039 [Candidatus Kryptonium thompsoni]CUS87251.1 hypothetical protein JGI7_01085 [Candidatus Kryptonium thompsoni]CUS91430.1 hypothetical protein JGI8_01547 [Candidatus Kryptonium thompsoni]CUS92164.1 hypothetical protein JGI6_01595 [Candidatus Kryptonium thompsoni]CUS93204.1 hypothetical protein JGI12_01693 [Candidatus Kryptonium thompsoni]